MVAVQKITHAQWLTGHCVDAYRVLGFFSAFYAFLPDPDEVPLLSRARRTPHAARRTPHDTRHTTHDTTHTHTIAHASAHWLAFCRRPIMW